MSVPELVRERLGEEAVEATVSLDGDDALVVTATRTLLYRGEGLISDASVEEYSHDAESVTVSENGKKSTVRLDHGIEGESEFPVPTDRLDEIVPPLLAGVFGVNGVLDASEAVEEVYRLGELTLVIAGRRVVKHVGDALWDVDAEEYHYDDVTRIDVEKGEVSSQLIVEVGGRPQWIKIPSDSAREIRERLENALLAYHDVSNYREFERLQNAGGEDAAGGDGTSTESEDADGGSSPAEFADAGDSGDAGLDFGSGVGGVVSADDSGSTDDVAAEVASLRAEVERQNEILQSQQRTIEQLIEELRNL